MMIFLYIYRMKNITPTSVNIDKFNEGMDMDITLKNLKDMTKKLALENRQATENKVVDANEIVSEDFDDEDFTASQGLQKLSNVALDGEVSFADKEDDEEMDNDDVTIELDVVDSPVDTTIDIIDDGMLDESALSDAFSTIGQGIKGLLKLLGKGLLVFIAALGGSFLFGLPGLLIAVMVAFGWAANSAEESTNVNEGFLSNLKQKASNLKKVIKDLKSMPKKDREAMAKKAKESPAGLQSVAAWIKKDAGLDNNKDAKTGGNPELVKGDKQVSEKHGDKNNRGWRKNKKSVKESDDSGFYGESGVYSAVDELESLRDETERRYKHLVDVITGVSQNSKTIVVHFICDEYEEGLVDQLKVATDFTYQVNHLDELRWTISATVEYEDGNEDEEFEIPEGGIKLNEMREPFYNNDYPEYIDDIVVDVTNVKKIKDAFRNAGWEIDDDLTDGFAVIPPGCTRKEYFELRFRNGDNLMDTISDAVRTHHYAPRYKDEIDIAKEELVSAFSLDNPLDEGMEVTEDDEGIDLSTMSDDEFDKLASMDDKAFEKFKSLSKDKRDFLLKDDDE